MSLKFDNHPQRVALASEAHARPFMVIDAPTQVSHIAVFCDEQLELHAHLLAELCRHFGVAAPESQAKHFSHDFGSFRLRWENHSEFSSYYFIAAEAVAEPFTLTPLRFVPDAWLAGLNSYVMAAAHVSLSKDWGHASAPQQVAQYFAGSVIVGSRVTNGGEVWTDFQIQPDGFSRFLIFDVDLREKQAGRLIQRVLEIDTYRMMAMLAFPRAWELSSALRDIETELAQLTQALIAGDEKKEQDLLRQLLELSSRLEALAVANNFRFSATEAYDKIIQTRISELREMRIEGVPTIGEFMQRRLLPAMDTCRSVRQRMETLAQRIGRTNDLLRTRIGITQEQQNRAILESMNRRAELQLRLQQAVEGLSVAAISYYLIGLANYALKGLKAAGVGLNVELSTGLLIPVLLAGVWWGIRRLRQVIHYSTDKNRHT